MIDFSCPECGSSVRAKSRTAGEAVECQKCGRPVSVPVEPPAGAGQREKVKPPSSVSTRTLVVGLVVWVVFGLIAYKVFFSGTSRESTHFKTGDRCSIKTPSGMSVVCVTFEAASRMLRAEKDGESASMALGLSRSDQVLLLGRSDRVRVREMAGLYVWIEVLEGEYRGRRGFVDDSWLAAP